MNTILNFLVFIAIALALLGLALYIRACRARPSDPKLQPRRAVPLWIFPRAAALLCLLFLAVLARAQPNVTVVPTLPNYWQTLTNSTVSATNGQVVLLTNQPIYLLKNGFSLMMRLRSTNIITATNVWTVYGDVTVDGTTNSTSHPFIWTVTNAPVAGTATVAGISGGTNEFYLNLAGTQFNNAAAIMIDGVTNNTVGSLGGNTNSTTMDWIEYGEYQN